jgi:hypothetical protein
VRVCVCARVFNIGHTLHNESLFIFTCAPMMNKDTQMHTLCTLPDALSSMLIMKHGCVLCKMHEQQAWPQVSRCQPTLPYSVSCVLLLQAMSVSRSTIHYSKQIHTCVM